MDRRLIHGCSPLLKGSFKLKQDKMQYIVISGKGGECFKIR